MPHRPLIITDELDGSVALVIENLRHRGIAPQLFQCERLFSSSVTISLTYDSDGELALLRDEESSEEIEISSCRRILRRRPSLPPASLYQHDDPAIASFVLDQYRSAVNSLFTLDAQWMNRAFADRQLDQNKLLGARIAHSVGMQIIPTVLTDSPEEWRKYVEIFTRHGDIAVKPTSGWAARLADSDLVVSLFTKRLTRQQAYELADLVAYAPVLLQPYIEKAFELRITMVDGTPFACRIDSQATEVTSVDWRHYDFERTPHSPYKLSDDLTARLAAFMKNSNLLYAGIDMIVTKDGRPLFVEANPAGQFGWIEELTGLGISDAIADWLVKTP